MTDYKELARKMAYSEYPAEPAEGSLGRAMEAGGYIRAMERLLPEMEKNMEYMKHKNACGWYETDGVCDCGLDVHLSTLRSLLGQQ